MVDGGNRNDRNCPKDCSCLAAPGQMLLRTLWLSLDPYMRGRMSDAPSYAKPVGIGDVMEGGTVSEVVASDISRFAKGDVVVGRTGWQTYALSDGSSLQKVEPARAPQFRPHSASSGCRA